MAPLPQRKEGSEVTGLYVVIVVLGLGAVVLAARSEDEL